MTMQQQLPPPDLQDEPLEPIEPVAPPPQEEFTEPKDPTGGQEPILPDYKSKTKQGAVVERLINIFQKYADSRQEVIEHAWELSEKLYMGEPIGSMWPYQSEYRIKEIFRQVQSSKAISFAAFFGQPKRFEYKARLEGADDLANAATHIVSNQIKTLGLETEMHRWHDQPHVLGTGYLSYGWSRFKRVRHKITEVPLKDHDIITNRDTEEISFGGPYLEWLDAWKVYTNPYIEDIANSPFVFVREIVGPEYLLTLANEGKLDRKAVMECLKLRGAADREQVDRRMQNVLASDDLFGDAEYELLHCWTSTGWMYSICVDHKILLQANRNVYGRVPIIDLIDNPRPGMHYGVGEPMVLAAEEMFLRDACALWIDNVHYQLQPMWLVHEDLRNQWEQTSFKPGASVYVAGSQAANAVQPVPVKQTNFELQGAIEFIRGGMSRTTGLTDEVTGQGSKHRTATGLVRLQEAASARLEHKIMQWQGKFEDVYLTLYGLNAAFLDTKVALRIDGLDGKPVSDHYGPANFEPEVDIEVLLPRTMEAPEQRQAKLLQLYQAVRQDPRVDVTPVLEELFRAYDFRAPKRLLVNKATSERDAIYENVDFDSTGFISDPMGADDHFIHYHIHEMYKATPQFLSKSPDQQAAMLMHCKIHEHYLEQMGMMQGPQQMAGQPGTLNGPAGAEGAAMMEGNANAEDMFGNGAAGAQAQGMPPGPPPQMAR